MRTFKRGLLGFVLIALLAGGASAQAANRPRVNQGLSVGTLRHSANYPSPGSSVVYAGTVKSGLGRGTILLTLAITGHPSSSTFRFKGTSTAFYPHGTTRGSFTGTGTVRAGGRFELAGRGHYTGGTLNREARRNYSFSGTAPAPPPSPRPPPAAACAVPAGWQVVAKDAEVVVILDQSPPPMQEYRYCDYADPGRGFQLLVQGLCGAGPSTCSTVDGVALSYILYDTGAYPDSPLCNGEGTEIVSSTVYAFDSASGKTMTLLQGDGAITSAQLSPSGVGAWILTDTPCMTSGDPRHETLDAVSLSTGVVTTLDSGDPGETISSPRSLANLEVYECGAGCPANTAVVAWTHDGTWRYEQVT